MTKHRKLDYVYLDEKTLNSLERNIKELMLQGGFDNEDDAGDWVRTHETNSLCIIHHKEW